VASIHIGPRWQQGKKHEIGDMDLGGGYEALALKV
jgi:hypothetical protein